MYRQPQLSVMLAMIMSWSAVFVVNPVKGVEREVKSGPKDVKGVDIGIGISIKSLEEKGLLDDVRDVVDLARDVQELFKSTESVEKSLLSDIRDVVSLASDVRDLFKELPEVKSEKSILLPDLRDIFTIAREVEARIKSSKAAKSADVEKIGFAEIAAAVALAREVSQLVKSSDEDSEKFIGEALAAIGIAREIYDLVKTTSSDNGVSLKSRPIHGEFVKFDVSGGYQRDTLPDFKGISSKDIMRELDFLALNTKTGKFIPDNELREVFGGRIWDRPALPRSPKVLKAELDRRQKIVYGDDDRTDLFRLSPDNPFEAAVLRNASSTCCGVRRARISLTGETYTARLQGTFREVKGVCSTEPFDEQPLLNFCTGFVVGPDLVATAGHCVESDDDARGMAFVFGFQLDADGAIPTNRMSFARNAVYFGQELVGRRFQDEGEDWAIVRVDRRIEGREPLTLAKQDVSIGDDVYVIGNPSGLPTKFAGGAEVKSNSNSIFFEANLDVYAGNSGSPVFSTESHEVVGVLVRGGKDFILSSAGTDIGCLETNFVGETTSDGEDVTRIKLVREQLGSLVE